MHYIYIYIYIYVQIKDGPFDWGCRIHRLYWSKMSPTSVLDMTLNNLMM